MHLQLLDRRMSSSEVDSGINGIIALLATELELLNQSVRELSERKWNRSTEGNAASERSRSSGQRSDSWSSLLTPYAEATPLVPTKTHSRMK